MHRLLTERFLEAGISEHDRNVGGSVMVWGTINLNCLSQLGVILGNSIHGFIPEGYTCLLSIPDGMLEFRDFKTLLHVTIYQVENLLHISSINSF